ncbi:MAG: RNA polymerase sigma factor [Clostridia bacterium]|nr:RNA polymerase sigma factor [Clostridia bacterium]
MSNEVDRLKLRDLYVSEYLEKLFYFCLKKTGDISEAEDLASDISLDILSAIEKGTEIENFPAWVWRIARNRYSSWVAEKSLRRGSFYPDDVSEYDVPSDECLEDSLTHNEDLKLLRRELAFIASEYREMIVAYYIKQKRISEIAKNLSIPEGTVKTKLYRARKILKEGLKMAREFGKRSYDPESIYFVANGYQPSHLAHPWKAVERKIPVNILCEANNNPSTAEELSIALGIALPYMEDEIALLEQATLLKKLDDGRYITSFFIYPVECENEINDVVCDYCEDTYEKIWELAVKTVKKEKSISCDFDAVGENDAAMFFAFLISGMIEKSALPESAFKKFVRPGGGNWGFCGFEEGYECRLPEEFFNGNGTHGWHGYQKGAVSERFPYFRYFVPGGVPSDWAIPALKLVADGNTYAELEADHKTALDYLIENAFVINDGGKLTVNALVIKDGYSYCDRIREEADFDLLVEITKEAAKKVYASVEKYSNPYLKEDFDYYVESGFFRKRAVFACLWKDRGLYTGTSAQFCALYID